MIRFGLALHLGEVMFGNIGASARLDFTVIGPAVNHAARLESLSAAFDRPVVVSAAIAAFLPDDAFTPLGAHPLKGIAEPQAVAFRSLPSEACCSAPSRRAARTLPRARLRKPASRRRSARAYGTARCRQGFQSQNRKRDLTKPLQALALPWPGRICIPRRPVFKKRGDLMLVRGGAPGPRLRPDRLGVQRLQPIHE